MLGDFIRGVLEAVLPFLFKRSAPPPPPSRVEVEAAEAASAKAALATQEQTNAQVAQAIQAERQSDARIAADPDSVRARDPDSRD